MAKITVTVRSDAGDLGEHLKYGPLVAGAKIVIDAEDFSAGLFINSKAIKPAQAAIKED